VHGPPAAAATRFDEQAASFDRRAGVPPQAAAEIAPALLGTATPAARANVVLELGPGTGEIGRHLALLADRYVGVDRSGPMLDVFRSKLAGTGPAPRGALLVQADSDDHWPVRDGSVTLVFASRVAHLLSRAHVVGEAVRVCGAGGRVVVGRIERSGLKSLLRRQREALLADRGVPGGGSGGRRTQALLEALVTAGGLREPKRTVTTWTTTTTAEEVIAGWEAMPTMGGEAIGSETRGELLAELRGWARTHVGDLHRPETQTEQYTLEGVRLG
jgi:SAM-dependent methyltransferase